MRHERTRAGNGRHLERGLRSLIVSHRKRVSCNPFPAIPLCAKKDILPMSFALPIFDKRRDFLACLNLRRL